MFQRMSRWNVVANCQKVKTAMSLDITFGKILAQMRLAYLGH